MRYLLWQFRHMHTFYFNTSAKNEPYCPVCGAVYQQRKPMSTNRDDVTPAKPTKAPVSVLAAMSLGLLVLGFVFLSIGALLPTLPVFIYFGFFDVIASVTLAVLSLREDK